MDFFAVKKKIKVNFKMVKLKVEKSEGFLSQNIFRLKG